MYCPHGWPKDRHCRDCVDERNQMERDARAFRDAKHRAATEESQKVRERDREIATLRASLARAEAERDAARAELVQRGMEIDALVAEKRDAVAAFHDASRLRSQIQAERIKAEDERDARPMITVEDAAAWLRGTRNEATMDDEAGQIRLRDALRAHAAKAAPKGDKR